MPTFSGIISNLYSQTRIRDSPRSFSLYNGESKEVQARTPNILHISIRRQFNSSMIGLMQKETIENAEIELSQRIFVPVN